MLPRRLSVIAAGSVLAGALLLVSSEPVRAQAAGKNVLRSWSCLASSVTAGSIFQNVVSDPACVPVQAAVAWPPLARTANAIIPPGTPTGLAATVIGQTVVLTWTPATTGGEPTSYLFQAGSASGLANLANASTGSSSPTLTATAVPPGRYFERVIAQNASGTSVSSNEIVVTVAGACTTTSGAPTGLAAIVSGATVSLTWNAPGSGCAPTAYIIQAGSAPGLSDLASFSTGSAATGFAAGGVPSGLYYVRVLANDGAGTSGPTNEVPIPVNVCGVGPGAPVGLSASVAGSTVALAWGEASGSPTGYAVLAGSSPGASNLGQFGVIGTVFRGNGVPAGTYFVRVIARNACGSGPPSNEVVVIVGGPAVPVTVTGVHQFSGSPNDGSNRSTILQASDGNFYGTSVTGGPNTQFCNTNLTGCGIVWKMTPAGALTVLHSFKASGISHNASPIYPYSTLIQANDGNLYGTTSEGPAVFRITPAGSLTFMTNLGGGSYGNLIQAPDGNFYGTTAVGGAGTCSDDRSATCFTQKGSGTVFKMSPAGVLTTLHVFSGGADGSKPYAGLVIGTDGSFYGTTQSGASGFGTVFRIQPDGKLTTLYTFTGGADGGNPYATLIQASDGNFYGSTLYGTVAGAGTLFRMTPAGALTVLHRFTGYDSPDFTPRPEEATDGAFPGGALIQGPDGNMYGLTGGGGALGGGTAFMLTLAGQYTQLYAFAGNAEGGSPTTPLIYARDGNYYGTAQYGGSFNMGAIFRMTPPK